MQYMLIHCFDQFAGLTEEQVARADSELSSWLEKTARAGVRLHGARLQPVAAARTVRVRDGQALVSDGPFAETKEQVAGYDIIECADLDQAIEVASGHPTAWLGSIEVRPVLEG
jgi:hypothetical protein